MDPVQQPPALSPLRLHANGAAAAEAGEEPLVIQPSEVDVSIDFASVGGLASHLEALRETVLLSLLQPQLVARLGLRPPRGLLLHGPPGTGKTLLARALAGQAAAALGRPLAFFARKGADLLSKWAGEAERQLRVLFETAQASAPSIIFFDEIDGLAPARSAGHEQVHNSIVSTLLALMDGLESRGNVIIIGATNRPDALDPALRRPGRFDRELRFDLPDRAGRLQILQIHARRWPAAQRPPGAVLEDVAGRTAGFAGADLQLLCTEAALSALRRCVGAEGLRALTGARQGGAGPGAPIDEFLPGEGDPCLRVAPADFERALQTLKPASSRAGDSHRVAQPLPAHLAPLLGREVRRLAKTLARLFPRLSLSRAQAGEVGVGHALADGYSHSAFVGTPRPRLCLRDPGACTRAADAVARAALSLLEQEVAPFSAVSLSLAELLAEPAAAPEEAIARAVARARAAAPSVLFLSHLGAWERTLGAAANALLCTLLDGLDDTVCVLATRAGDSDDQGTLRDRLFEGCELEIQKSKKRSRAAFFRPVVRHLYDVTSCQAADALRGGNQRMSLQPDNEPTLALGGGESTNDSLTVRRALRRALLHTLRALDGAGHGSGKTQGLLHRVNVQRGLSVTCALSDLEQALESDAPAADPQWRTELLAAAERQCRVLLAKAWEEVDAARRRPVEDRATALLRRLKKLVPPQTVAT